MSLTVSLLPRRVSNLGEACALGCTRDIVSAQCATHGFPIVKVRVVDTRTMKPVSGEATLLAGIRALDMLRTHAPDMDRRVDGNIEYLRLQDVATGEFVAW